MSYAKISYLFKDSDGDSDLKHKKNKIKTVELFSHVWFSAHHLKPVLIYFFIVQKCVL